MKDKKHYFIRISSETAKYDDVELTKEEAHSIIPKGEYCYSRGENGEFVICPFWDIFVDLTDQENGFCHFLKEGDFTKNGTSLLWDQCKECGVNLDDE